MEIPWISANGFPGKREEAKRAGIKIPVTEEPIEVNSEEEAVPEIKGRKTLSDFMNSIKDGLIDLFKEDADRALEGTK